MIHFQLIFVCDRRHRSQFIFFFFCIWISNCSSTIYWTDSPFPTDLTLHSSQTPVIYIHMSLFLGSPFCSTNLYIYLYANTSHCLEDRRFRISFESGECQFSNFGFLERSFWLFKFFAFFIGQFLQKKLAEFLVGIESTYLASTENFTILSLLVHKYSRYLPILRSPLISLMNVLQCT